MKKLSKQHFSIYTAFLAVLSIISTSLPALADDQALDTIVVTATRTEQKIIDSLSTTTVITRDEIDRIRPTDFVDLLKREAGIDFTRSGGKGATASLFLRGTNANQTVFLIDGVRINTASNGAATLELIDMENIDHIEILRGPASSLYGNDAIGGVVQIFTRKGASALNETTIKQGYGSNAELLTAIQTGGNIHGTYYNVSTSYDRSNGINATNKDNFAYDPDHEAYRNAGIGLTVGHHFDAGHNIDFSFNQHEGQNEFDRGEADFQTQTAALTGALQFTDALKSALTLSHAYDKQKTPAFASIFNTYRDSALSQTDWQIGKHNLVTTGIEYVYESLDTNQGYTEDKRINRALFLQDQVTLGRNSLQAGVRHDDNTQYGTENTWNTGYGFAFTDSLKIFVNYGTAFKAPSFNDLYFPYTDYCSGFGFICASVGNPDLDAEKSYTRELGIKGQSKNTYWTASIYQTKIKHLISWQQTFGPGPFDSTWAPVNTDSATIEGLDTTAGTVIANWRFAARASLLNPTDDDTGQRLLRRSKQIAGIDADVDVIKKLSMGASWNVQGNRRDSTGYDGGFNTVDLRSTYYVLQDLKLALSVKNIFDNDYTVAYGYEAPGREAMLTAELTF